MAPVTIAVTLAVVNIVAHVWNRTSEKGVKCEVEAYVCIFITAIVSELRTESCANCFCPGLVYARTNEILNVNLKMRLRKLALSCILELFSTHLRSDSGRFYQIGRPIGS